MSALSGKKIRVIKNASFYATLEMMGATPVPLAINKITAALQAGTIDGLEQDAPTILANKWADIAQHVTLTQHIFSPVMPVISRHAFEKIPQELRAPFLEAAKEATSLQRQQAHTTEQRAIEQLRSSGVIIQSIDREPFQRSVKPLWNIFTTIHPATKEILTQLHTSLALER
jgi:TRAP-type C4-dicarboxylate transport system substrate-binding protein